MWYKLAMGSQGRELERLFRRIQAELFQAPGKAKSEAGAAAEELAFIAAQSLKEKGLVKNWRPHDPQLDANGVDYLCGSAAR